MLPISRHQGCQPVLKAGCLADVFQTAIKAGFPADILAAALAHASFGQAPSAALTTNRPVTPKAGSYLCTPNASIIAIMMLSLMSMGSWLSAVPQHSTDWRECACMHLGAEQLQQFCMADLHYLNLKIKPQPGGPCKLFARRPDAAHACAASRGVAAAVLGCPGSFRPQMCLPAPVSGPRKRLGVWRHAAARQQPLCHCLIRTPQSAELRLGRRCRRIHIGAN